MTFQMFMLWALSDAGTVSRVIQLTQYRLIKLLSSLLPLARAGNFYFFSVVGCRNSLTARLNMLGWSTNVMCPLLGRINNYPR
jgi:hypothetical protein